MLLRGSPLRWVWLPTWPEGPPAYPRSMPLEWTSAAALPVTLTPMLNSIFTRAERLAWWHPRPCWTCCPRWRQCCHLWATWLESCRNHITDKASFVTSTYNHLSVLIHYSVIHVYRKYDPYPCILGIPVMPALSTTCKFYIFICFVLRKVSCFRQFDIWIISLFRAHKNTCLFSSLWILVFKMKWPYFSKPKQLS